MLLSLGRNRGFVFSLDAVLSFVIVIGFSGALFLFLDQNENLDSEYLYQISQDIMEVCSIKADFSQGCFDFLNKTGAHYAFFVNGEKGFGENGTAEVTITRHYSRTEIKLRTWA